MGAVISVLVLIAFAVVTFIVIWSLKQPGSVWMTRKHRERLQRLRPGEVQRDDDQSQKKRGRKAA